MKDDIGIFDIIALIVSATAVTITILAHCR
jgi:hypothetical protein